MFGVVVMFYECGESYRIENERFGSATFIQQHDKECSKISGTRSLTVEEREK